MTRLAKIHQLAVLLDNCYTQLPSFLYTEQNKFLTYPSPYKRAYNETRDICSFAKFVSSEWWDNNRTILIFVPYVVFNDFIEFKRRDCYENSIPFAKKYTDFVFPLHARTMLVKNKEIPTSHMIATFAENILPALIDNRLQITFSNTDHKNVAILKHINDIKHEDIFIDGTFDRKATYKYMSINYICAAINQLSLRKKLPVVDLKDLVTI